MKNLGRLTGLVLSLALVLLLAVPAKAAYTYDLLYDATQLLDQDYCADFGSKQLRELTDAHKTQMRVDVIMDSEGFPLEEYAEAFYDSFGYGYEETLDGVLLMILVEQEKDNLTFGGYALVCGGENKDHLRGLVPHAEAALEPWLNAESWNGDMEGDNAAFQGAIDAYTDCAGKYLRGELQPLETEPAATEATEPETVEELTKAGDYTADETQLLTYEDWVQLEVQAKLVSRRNDCGVYFLIVEDYAADGSGTIQEAVQKRYEALELGVGADRSGILLMISTGEGGYAFHAQGLAEERIPRKDREKLSENLLEYFSDGDSAGGLMDYLERCDEYLSEEPVEFELGTVVPTVLVVACGLIAVTQLLRKKKED